MLFEKYEKKNNSNNSIFYVLSMCRRVFEIRFKLFICLETERLLYVSLKYFSVF